MKAPEDSESPYYLDHSGPKDRWSLQVKICGLTRPEEALACAEFGAAAVGLVFYPPSPRYVTEERAREITGSLPAQVCPVGVFVDETFTIIMKRVEGCGLRAVQLHGREPPEFGEMLLQQGIIVIRGLYMNKEPSINHAGQYHASAYLLEYSGGSLPGGNALAWDWSAATGICRLKPLILAGGLNPENVAPAIEAALPDAVDVSSGVEARPGKKDIDKIKAFLEAANRARLLRKPEKLF